MTQANPIETKDNRRPQATAGRNSIYAAQNGEEVRQKGGLTGLMKRMGVPNGVFSPLPPDQHRWQGSPGEPPLQRMWSLITGHTCALDHQCEYAVDQAGKELRMKDVAAALGMDLAQAYRIWDIGVLKGIWRGSSPKEPPHRLYLCGTVKPRAALETLEEDQGTTGTEDCTVNLPAAIRKQIKDWVPDKIAQLEKDFRAVQRAGEELITDAIAGARRVVIEIEDNLFTRYGVKANRQPHQKTSETEEDAQARRDRIVPLLPAFRNFVQSISEKSAQVEKDGSAQSKNSVVQRDAPAPSLYTDLQTKSQRKTRTPEVSSTDLEHMARVPPDFERFIGGFLAAGKLLNDQDVAKARAVWSTLHPEDQAAALACLEPKFTDGTWSDARHTPMPVNYLYSQAWKRKGPGRVLRNSMSAKEALKERLREEYVKGAKA